MVLWFTFRSGLPARPWRPWRCALEGAVMLTASFRRKTILLLLAAILAVPTASAAAPRIEVPTPDRSTHSAPLELLGRALSFLRSAWSKEGCDINPNGHCTKG